DDLLAELRRETDAPRSGEKLCRGTLISRQQYLPDVEEWGYADARLAPPDAQAVYRHVLESLRAGGVDFLVGGAYAFTRYTGIERSTKDFDVFVRYTDRVRALDVLADAGFDTEETFPHWLAKAFWDDDFVDVIYSSGNGVAPVDDEWFAHAPEADVLGVRAKICPAEEILWSKAFVMERERYDGADVIHLMRCGAETLDWDRLLDRFGTRWRVLFSYVILFGFVYPGERTRIPRRVIEDLLARLGPELDADDASAAKVCQGTVVSRQQFLVDVQQWGYADARLRPRGNMSAEEIAYWTEAIGKIK
ncbi:MAG TPA: nucleotidyltransferase, partial [Gemmatimonadaceae bacterium]|nr:nucleotidyltransferase [Gemmatimonadaceae bacterium]